MDKLEIIINKINDIEKQLLAINEVLTNTFGKEILLPVDPYFEHCFVECRGFIFSIMFDIFDSIKIKKDSRSIKYNRKDLLENQIKLRQSLNSFISSNESDKLDVSLSNILDTQFTISSKILENIVDDMPNKCPWDLNDLINKSLDEFIKDIGG